MCKSNTPNSLLSIITHFKDKKTCLDFIVEKRWGSNPFCPHCYDDEIYKFKTRYIFKCKGCKKQFSPLKKTIFDNSKIQLTKWMAAIYLHTSHKKGISSIQLSKDIAVTQKTAWFMLGRIRHLILSGSMEFNDKLDGIVEIDETYVGGKEKNKHAHKRVKGTQGRSTKTKVAVLGMVERGGRLIAKKVDSVNGENLVPIVRDNIAASATIFTDEWRGYTKLKYSHDHSTVNHGTSEYVNGNTHVNTIEGFWSHFKRSIFGIYHVVSPKHIDLYIAESAFRYNTRNLTEFERIEVLLSKNNDKKISYADLIKKVA